MLKLRKSGNRFIRVSGIMALILIAWISAGKTEQKAENYKGDNTKAESKAAGKTETAIFAGGCFWCVESDFDKVPGVLETISGYTGGHTKNPTYKQVSYTETGHYEAVKIVFDPSKVSYKQLLHSYWRSVDPTDASGQFCDKGTSYRTAIFPTSKKQLDAANASWQKEQTTGKLNGRIMTKVIEAKTFYKAEGYHQNYYQTNPLKYKYYRYSCGRDKRLKYLWGDEALSGMKNLTH